MDATGTPDDSPGNSPDRGEASPDERAAATGEPPLAGRTPALRGYPGGPGVGPAGAAAAATAAAPSRRRLINGSAWQRAQGIWRESGVEWQRPVTDGAGGGAEGIPSRWSPPRAVPGAGAAAATGAGPARRRHRLITVAAAVVVVVLLAGVAVVALRAAGRGQHGAKPGAASPYPPARLADGDFRASAPVSPRGTFQSLNEVAASAGTVVAAGTQSDARLGRAQFFVSTDGGRSWRLAPVRAQDGGAPPAWEFPDTLAGGPGGWLALGPGAAWTSRDGRSWTRTSGHGVPVQPGDQVLALTRTSTGFLAAGQAMAAGTAGQSEPAIWTSPDGTNWHRAAGAAAGMSVPGGTVGKILNAASRGADTVVAAQVTKTATITAGTGTSPKRRRISYAEVDLFRSTNGGRTWAPVSIPALSGAGNWVTGLASSGGGFVTLRPGLDKAGASDGVVFASADGSSWHRTATIDAPKIEGQQLTGVSGSSQGAVVTGHLGNGTPVAYVSADGRTWRRAQIPGATAATSLTGFTVTTGARLVAAGAGAGQGGAQRGYLAVSGGVSGGGQHVVDLTALPGAFFPALTVNGIAAAAQPPPAGGAAATKVAVGSAGAQPAVWYSPAGGGWFPARTANPGVFSRAGTAGLSGVVDGSGGWLAVGGALGPFGQPVVVVSPDGRTWRASDSSGALAVPGASAHGAAYGHGGYVVVGERAANGRTAAAAWWAPRLLAAPSRTGTTKAAPAAMWARAGNAGKGDLDGPDAPRRMLSVTSASSGFVAVGSHGSRAAAWTSPDGHRWKLAVLPQPPGAGQASLQFVASSGDRVVAAGTVGGPYSPLPFAVVSLDGGHTWKEAQLPAPGGRAQVTGLTAATGGFAAVGSYGPSGRTAVVVWTSPDGRGWKTYAPRGTGLAGPGTNEITALTAAGGQLLGSGFAATQTTEHTTVWTAPPFPGRSGARSSPSP